MNDVREESRPTIETFNRQVREIIDDAWSAVRSANGPVLLYEFDGKVCSLHERSNGRRGEFIDASSLRHHLERVALWVRTTRGRQRTVRPPQMLAPVMMECPNGVLPHLDVELLPVREMLGWLVFEPNDWTSFVLAWWENFQDEAMTAAKLAEFCLKKGFLSAVLEAGPSGGAATRLGRAILTIRRRYLPIGGHMIIGPTIRNGRSCYRLTCRLTGQQ